MPQTTAFRTTIETKTLHYLLYNCKQGSNPAHIAPGNGLSGELLCTVALSGAFISLCTCICIGDVYVFCLPLSVDINHVLLHPKKTLKVAMAASTVTHVTLI